MQLKFFVIMAVLAAAIVLAPAQATIITSGSSGSPSDFGVITGVLLTQSLTTGVVASPTATFTGDYAYAVVDEGSSLVFLYQFSNQEGSPDPVLRTTHSSFAAFVTDVGYTSLVPVGTSVFVSAGDTPTGASRSANGSVVRYDFSGVGAGEHTNILAVRVEGEYWNEKGSFTAQDGSVGAILAPNPSEVPEPSTWILLGSALVGLAAYRRRKAVN